MFLAALISLIYKDGATLQISIAGLIVLVFGGLTMLVTKSPNKEMGKREGYIVVTFGWLIMAFSGTMPYLFTESIPVLQMLFLKPFLDIQQQVLLY